MTHKKPESQDYVYELAPQCRVTGEFKAYIFRKGSSLDFRGMPMGEKDIEARIQRIEGGNKYIPDLSMTVLDIVQTKNDEFRQHQQATPIQAERDELRRFQRQQLTGTPA